MSVVHAIMMKIFGRGVVINRGYSVVCRMDEYDDKKFDKITEGLVKTVVERVDEKTKSAFYNPAQVVNRDLSLFMIQSYIDEKRAGGYEGELSYLEALSASGIFLNVLFSL